MIMKLRQSGLHWPFILSLVGIVILVMLGNWQMRRKTWKAELIQLVQERIGSEPVGIETLSQRALEGKDIRYQPVKVTGSFEFAHERFYFLPLKNQTGWHVFTPLALASGDIVFIDRGFVPEGFKQQSARRDGLPSGQVEIEGLARPFQDRQGMFVPDNNSGDNQWYWRDGQALYDSLPGYQGQRFAFMIDAKKSAQYGKWPRAGVTRVKFQDKHLGYALTWYGLALTLVGVFGAFAFVRLRN